MLGPSDKTSLRLPFEFLEHYLNIKLLDYTDTENVLIVFADVVSGRLVFVFRPLRNTFFSTV